MARASKTVSTVVKSAPGTQLANIDAELAADVALLKNSIGQATGNKIKVEASGNFKLPDGMDLGNEIQVVIVDFATHHDYYAGPYNPNSLEPPICYARGKDLSTLAPEPDSPEIQHADCKSCPLNAFGSGANGTSKACKNSRVLAVLLIDPENPEASTEKDAPIYILALPPTAIKSFDGMMAGVQRSLGHPIKAIITMMAKNVGTYALISCVDPLPNPDYAVHASRRAEVQDILYRKPDFAAHEAKAAQAPARARAPARRAAAPAARR